MKYAIKWKHKLILKIINNLIILIHFKMILKVLNHFMITINYINKVKIIDLEDPEWKIDLILYKHINYKIH